MLRIYAILTGQSAGVISSVFRIILMPLSWVYGLAMMARNYFYDRKILTSLNLASQAFPEFRLQSSHYTERL